MKIARALFVLPAIGVAYACASADTSAAIVLNQWSVQSLATKSASGEIRRSKVSGFFVLRSDLGYSENITVDGTSHTQLNTYTATETPCDASICPVTGTITLSVTSIEPVSYNYDIKTVDGGGPDGGLGGTMTWTSGALPDGGEIDAGPNAALEEWTFTLDSNTVLPQ